jgi:replication factor A1
VFYALNRLDTYAVKLIFDVNPPSFRQQNGTGIKSLNDDLVHFWRHCTKRRNTYLKINELRDGMRKVDVEADVIEKSDAREVRSRFTNETYKVADATVEDETGKITLTLWNEQVEQVNVGDRIKIENGYIKSFRDVLQLNSGKYGTLTVL